MEESWADLDPGRPTVSTSAVVAGHAMQFKYLQTLIILELNMQIMSLKDGNASVELPSSTHNYYY